MRLLRLVVACCVLFVPASLLAQGSSISGRVVDPQGAAVPGAQVALSADAGTPRSAVSASDGSFSFQGVAPGRYTVRVEAPGFVPATQPVDHGTSGQTISVPLQVAGISEDVSVTGALLGTAATGKTTLPLRELPMTINTLSADLIAQQGTNDLVTALQNVPGVNPFTTYGVYEYYAFRGFLDSVQLLDGVRNEGNRVNAQLTGIERVDVLKGPSSALYGGGALGATVNLIRKKPSEISSYEFMAAGGSWSTGRGAFGAGGRLGSDALLYRFDVGADSSNGYRNEDVTRVTVTPSVAWRLGTKGQVNVYYTFNRDRFAGDAGLPLVDTDLGVPVKANIPDVPHDRNYRTPQDDATSYDNNIQVAYAKQLTNSLGFRDTLSYRHFNDEYFLSEEVDFIAPRTIDRYYLYFKHHRRPLMNIAELTGHFSTRVEHDLVAGWESQRYHNFTTLPEEDFFQAASIDAFDPVETQGPSDLTPASANVFTNTINAFYGQDHIALTPQLKLLASGRVDIYRRSSHSDPIENGVQTEGDVSHREANAFTGRLGLVYQASSTVDLYGSYATSFKPPTIAQPDGSSLDPETGAQGEFGQRFHLLNNRAELNTSIYQINKKNVAFRRPGGVYVQAGEVRSRGFEADFTTSLRSNWRVNASYGLTDAEFLDYEESVGTNLRGNTPTFAPLHTFNVWTSYDLQNGLGFNVGVRSISQVFADNDNLFVVDGYGVLNLGARYRHGRFEYSLNINNLTSTDYFVPHQDYPQVYPGAPINALGTVRVRLK